MDPSYAAAYRDLHERHWWWRVREAVVREELLRRMPSGRWMRALDVGCGDGLHFPMLLDMAAEVDGVEPDRALLTQRGRIDSGGRIYEQPFDPRFAPGRRYDLVVFLDVLEHMERPAEAVAHAADLMEPGGLVMITVPAHRSLWTTHDDLNRHVTRYTAQEVRALLEPDFDVEEMRYFFRWVHAAKLAQRAVEAIRTPEPSVPTVPPEPVNTLLRAFSRGEEWLTRRLPLRVGSSLLAIGRKRAASPG